MAVVVLASGNTGKITELQNLFTGTSWQIMPQSHWHLKNVEEVGTTFIENALLKARHAAKQTGLPALADDSGLVVEALQGLPGLYSSRYAGESATDEQNVIKLLDAMQHVPMTQRHAAFVCVIVFLRHTMDPLPIIATGLWHGEISTVQQGSKGFGYDPIFYDPMHQCTAAEMSIAVKNLISHRAQAFTQLKAHLLAAKLW